MGTVLCQCSVLCRGTEGLLPRLEPYTISPAQAESEELAHVLQNISVCEAPGWLASELPDGPAEEVNMAEGQETALDGRQLSLSGNVPKLSVPCD